jgi:aryl-alcohol dehydrogenase-like predicted oxidoreductase
VRLGRTDVEVTRLGLGTVPLGWQIDDDEVGEALIDAAWRLGVRFFDAAPMYGEGLAERRLGAALSHHPRDEFVLSTKVGRLLRPGAAGHPEWFFDFSYDATMRSLAESLDRLGLDRVDVALIHDPDDHYEEALTGAYRALDRLRSEGVVRAIGAGMNQTAMLCRFAREADPDCFLVAGRYSLLDRIAAEELMPLCESRSISLIIGGVFNSGILAGGDTYDGLPASTTVHEETDRVRTLCATWNVPLAAAAVQFPLDRPEVASVLVGCRSAEELEADARLFELEIPPDFWDELRRLDALPTEAARS